MKVCPRCHRKKPISEFGSQVVPYKLVDGTKKTWTRVKPYCRPCDAERQREKRKNLTKKQRAQRLETHREYRKRRPDVFRNMELKRDFGIDLETYNSMLKAQGGVCAICGNPPNGKSLAVDEDHSTRRVRALLCHNCNVGLGHFRDSMDLLQSALAYLHIHSL